METLSALLVLCEGDPPVIGSFPSKRVSNTGFDAFVDVSLNKRWRNNQIAGDLKRPYTHWDSNEI